MLNKTHRWLRGAALAALTAALTLQPVAVTAGGLPIGPNVQVTDAGLGSEKASTPDIVVRDNTVYTTWRDTRDDGAVNGSIYFAKSTDGGTTWSANKRVSDLAYDGWADDPAIAVQPNGAIWIVWWQFYRNNSVTVNDIRLAKSTDGGATFQLSALFDGDDASEDTRYPQIAVDDSTGKLYVLYHEFWNRSGTTGYEFTVITFDANGQKLSTVSASDVPVPGRGDNNFLNNPRMSLTARNGVVCAGWEDQRNRFAIYGACSSDGGATFGANFAISDSDMQLPRIALAPDGSLYASYRLQADARKNVLLRRSPDKGATWGDARNSTLITAVSEEVRAWDLALDENGQIALTWIIKRGSRSDIYISTSLDQGLNYSTNKIQDNQGKYPTVSDQYEVAVAVGGAGVQTRAYMVWADDRNVNSQLWAQVVSIDGIPPSAPANLQAAPDDRSILLSWGAATDSNGIVGYRVLRATASGGPYSVISAILIKSTTYRDVELDATPYFYRVIAIDGTGNIGPGSNEASATAQVNAPSSAVGTLAFSSGGNIQLRDFPAGVIRTAAQGARPHFSKDGMRVFYFTNKTITARPVAGGNPQPIFQNNDATSFYDVADIDSRVAIILQRIGLAPIEAGGTCILFEPHYFDRAQDVYTGANDITQNIAVSPEGDWIAYNYRGFCNIAAVGTTTPGDLCVVKLATGKRICMNAYYREPDFAPTGGWLVFSADLTGQFEIWKAQLQADGTLAGLTQLTRGPANEPASEPNWSSDSNWIVFKRDVDPSAGVNWQLHIVRADGAGARNLGIAGEEPAWFGGGSAPPIPGLQQRAYLPLTVR